MESGIRTPKADATAASIFEAATRLFSERGFGETSVRDIAAAANVDKMLIGRYFGSKKSLFQSVAEVLISAEDWTRESKDHFAEAVAYRLCGTGGPGADSLQFLIRSCSHPEAAGILADVVHRQVLKPLANWLGGPDAEERAGLLIGQIAGFGLLSSVLGVLPLAGGSERVAALLARELEAAVNPSPQG